MLRSRRSLRLEAWGCAILRDGASRLLRMRILDFRVRPSGPAFASAKSSAALADAELHIVSPRRARDARLPAGGPERPERKGRAQFRSARVRQASPAQDRSGAAGGNAARFARYTRSLRLASSAPPEDLPFLSSAVWPVANEPGWPDLGRRGPAHHACERGLRSPCNRADETRFPRANSVRNSALAAQWNAKHSTRAARARRPSHLCIFSYSCQDGPHEPVVPALVAAIHAGPLAPLERPAAIVCAEARDKPGHDG